MSTNFNVEDLIIEMELEDKPYAKEAMLKGNLTYSEMNNILSKIIGLKLNHLAIFVECCTRLSKEQLQLGLNDECNLCLKNVNPDDEVEIYDEPSLVMAMSRWLANKKK